MGFWEKAGHVAFEAAKGAAEKMEEKQQRLEQYAERYERYDDERLIKEFNRSSGERKIAMAYVMRNRGLR